MMPIVLWLYLFTGTALAQQHEDRYFKEDHLTGADYIRLSVDQTYVRTVREHMGIWTIESGQWEQSGDEIMFVPKERKKERYAGTDVSYRARRFLAFRTDAAPGLVIPTEEIKRRLDADPTGLPPYVFFEIDRTAYERETKETYPFRTEPRRKK